MNNRKQNKQPLFAEVNLTGDEFEKSPSTHIQRTRFLKLVYPNNVTLILPGDISASQLEHWRIVESPIMVEQFQVKGVKGVFQLPNFKPITYSHPYPH